MVSKKPWDLRNTRYIIAWPHIKGAGLWCPLLHYYPLLHSFWLCGRGANKIPSPLITLHWVVGSSAHRWKPQVSLIRSKGWVHGAGRKDVPTVTTVLPQTVYSENPASSRLTKGNACLRKLNVILLFSSWLNGSIWGKASPPEIWKIRKSNLWIKASILISEMDRNRNRDRERSHMVDNHFWGRQFSQLHWALEDGVLHTMTSHGIWYTFSPTLSPSQVRIQLHGLYT